MSDIIPPPTDSLVSNEGDWNKSNVETLIEWVSISALNMKILDKTISYYRTIIRRNIIIGLILSTSSGTLSAVRINSTNTSDLFSFSMNILFTGMSFLIAYSSGYIKVFQVQEKLEQFIKIKQEWISFSTLIASELQLPVKLRQNASKLIEKYKLTYLDLLKYDLEIPPFIRKEIEESMGLKKIKTTLSDIIIEIVVDEAKIYNIPESNIRIENSNNNEESKKNCLSFSMV